MSGLEVKSSWQIRLGDAPIYADRLAWAPDSRRLAVGSVSDKRMSVWDVSDLRRLPAPGDQAGGVQELAYSPDGRYLAVARGSTAPGNERYAMSIRDAGSGALIQALTGEPSEIKLLEGTSVAFSPDGRYLAAGFLPRTALYSRDGGEWRRVGGLGPGAHRVAFSPDSTSLAISGSGGPLISLCRVPSMDVLRAWRSVGGPDQAWGYATLAYRPSGGQIAAGRGPDLGIFQPEDGTLVGQVKFQSILGLAYSPDGRHLAVADARLIYVLDSESRTQRLTLAPGPGRRVHRVAFSPDGTMLAAATGPEVTIWEFLR
jgi:WD40 repeat protein